MNIILRLIKENKLKELDAVLKRLTNDDIDTNNMGYTSLWYTITGNYKRLECMNKNQNVMSETPEVTSNLEALKILLEHGANPNKKCIHVTSLHVAIMTKNLNIVVALLNYDADINGYSFIKIVDRHCLCVIPIVQAIREGDIDLVNICLINGSIFTEKTIEFAKTIRDTAKGDMKKSYEHREIYREREKIVTLLEKKHDSSLETRATMFYKNNDSTGSYPNVFIGLF
jgi:ankyrin repeat protein